MKKITLLLCLMMGLTLSSSAQRYIGIATSNWSGTNGLYLNPANIADSRHKFTIDLFSMNAGFDNSLAGIKTKKALKYINDDESVTFASFLNFNDGDNLNMLAPYAEVRGPGAMISLNDKHSIAITTRVRAINQVHNFNKDLFRTLIDEEFRNSSNSDYVVRANNFNYTTHAWTEIGLSYGGVIYDGGEHFIKGGITVRYLMGAGYISLTSNNMDVISYAGKDSVYVTNSDLHFATTLNDNDEFGSNINDYLFNSLGKGFGGDIGIVYEWRPDHKNKKYRYDMDGKENVLDRSQNLYKLRLSASITDFGAIKYNGTNFEAKISGTGSITGEATSDSFKTYSLLKQYAENRGFSVDTGSGNNASTRLTLPTSLVLSADYHVIKNLYVNGMFVANVAQRSDFGNSYYSQFTVTPRWDNRIFSVGMPITYNTLAKNIRAGLGVRVAGFFVGSDDMLGFFSNNTKGFNMYFGAYVPFNYKRPKDNDKDLVSNKKDLCPKEKGTWELRGCPVPDKDGDGILDSVDKCPNIVGVISADGCPDMDGDGIADADDRCPETPGPEAHQGCPDTDRDGIVDIDDDCPTVAGLAQYAGCPDRDNDGVIDSKDRCPDEAGPASNYGCPEVTEEEEEQLEFAATAVEFELNKATIKSSSYTLLDEIVELLKKYPAYIMNIDGYTDNTGSDKINNRLSKERANTVRDYFISKGIDAARLNADGHGSSNPVGDNSTREGRAKNRRVEMKMEIKE